MLFAKRKAVKLDAKIMDSGVSRIQMWREQKKKERQEKRRVHYEKNRKKIIEKVEGRKTSRAAKSGQLWNVAWTKPAEVRLRKLSETGEREKDG